MDLILLRTVYHVDLGEMLRICFKAYVNHKPISFHPLISPDASKKYIYKKSHASAQNEEQIIFPTQCIYANFDEKKDRECIEFWNGILKGYRTMFAKQLLRMYINTPMLPEFMAEGKTDLQVTRKDDAELYEFPLKTSKAKKKRTREELEREILQKEPTITGNEQLRQQIEDKILKPKEIVPEPEEKQEKTVLEEPMEIKPVSFEEKQPEIQNENEEDDLMALMAAWTN